jgi:membrane associated rhomboid family serine protease
VLRRPDSEPVNGWIVATIIASVVGWIVGRFAAWCALIPSRVIQGDVWRIFTWPFVEIGPMALVVTCASIYKFGGELVPIWGERRLRRYMLHVIGAATVVTCLFALASGHRYLVRMGGWAVADVLTIAWARQFPDRAISFQGLVEFRGQRLINVTIGVAILFALYFGPVTMAPELAACAAAALYPREWLRKK